MCVFRLNDRSIEPVWAGTVINTHPDASIIPQTYQKTPTKMSFSLSVIASSSIIKRRKHQPPSPAKQRSQPTTGNLETYYHNLRDLTEKVVLKLLDKKYSETQHVTEPSACLQHDTEPKGKAKKARPCTRVKHSRRLLSSVVATSFFGFDAITTTDSETTRCALLSPKMRQEELHIERSNLGLGLPKVFLLSH